jgi:endonuclease/exonuclease/phosphatase family metal-dependent hydrolase
MRLASYNVENLFDRARAMNHETWAEGRPVLDAFASLNALLGEIRYTEARKRRMVALFKQLGLEKADTGPFVILRRNRGSLLRRPRGGGLEIIAEGRADWVGTLELRDEPVTERAMQNTARVIAGLQPDVLGVVEVESRPVLAAFNSEVIAALGGTPFRHAMVIDGNDERGIDVGLLTGDAYPIGRMRSHVDDRLTDGGLLFSRDCPEFELATPRGDRMVVLVNHFKSKGYGGTASSNARRRAQAERVATIYRGLVKEGINLVAVIGDLNDTPESEPLAPLMRGTNLRDAFTHPPTRSTICYFLLLCSKRLRAAGSSAVACGRARAQRDGKPTRRWLAHKMLDPITQQFG